ncbi:hypothetical protein GCM10010172_17090 [Paractinoplanes ferrugineus]|uniref:Uncharacterized protein n=2 Tax=Paractinoplanes ferrugineus TaxID=113564 RepID=A0A919J1D0_9ACTN|nr:hypothetical protein Afe05nite_35220 [Actinoplanes ferrugineus]
MGIGALLACFTRMEDRGQDRAVLQSVSIPQAGQRRETAPKLVPRVGHTTQNGGKSGDHFPYRKYAAGLYSGCPGNRAAARTTARGEREMTYPENINLETPEADAAEQAVSARLDQDTEPSLDVEAPEWDAREQSRTVELEDDDYR